MNQKRKLFISIIVGFILAILALGAVTVMAGPNAQAPTLISYQGFLTGSDGNPMTGTVTLQFDLYDSETGGSALWSETQNSVTVTDGYFAVMLGEVAPIDAGDFSGSERWLQVTVDGTTMPRQRFASVPYALQAENAASAASVPWSGITGIPAGFADGVDDVGTGSSGWALTGNSGTTASNVLGTTDAQTLTMVVNNAIAMRFVPSVDDISGVVVPNVIGGHSANNVAAGAYGAVIAGGGGDDGFGTPLKNSVTASYGTISGGNNNTAGQLAVIGGGGSNTADGTYATVSGGEHNTASGNHSAITGGHNNTVNAESSFIGGGQSNQVNSIADMYATIGGGLSNSISGGQYSTIGGGDYNEITADHSTIGGGLRNHANGTYGFIGGGRDHTISGNYSAIGGGDTNIISSTNAFIGAGANNTIAVTGTYAAIGGGSNNTTSGYAATIGGGTGNNATASTGTIGGGSNNTASNTSTTISGGANNTTSGFAATVGGGTNNDAGLVDADRYAVIGGGYGNHITGGYDSTIGGGGSNQITADHSTIGGGQSNQSKGQYGTIGGGYLNVISATNSTIPGGYQAQTTHYGEMAYAGGNFANPGDAQATTYVLRGTTTDDGGNYYLYLDGDTGSESITIPASHAMFFDIQVVAIESSSNNYSAGYHFTGIIKRDLNNNTTFIGTPTQDTFEGTGSSAWNAEVTADDINEALAIHVTGDTGQTIRWVATVRATEVAF